MLHHLSFAVTDLTRSAAFYDAALSPLGYLKVRSDATAVGYGLPGGEDQFAIKLRPNALTVPGDGVHVAFAAPSRSQWTPSTAPRLARMAVRTMVDPASTPNTAQTTMPPL